MPAERGLLRHLNRAEEYLAVTTLVTLGITLTAQVFMRYVLGIGFGWVEELVRIQFIYVIYLGMIVGMQRYLHIRVTAGLLLFPEAMARALRAFADLVLFGFCLAVAWHAAEMALNALQFTFELKHLGISMFWAFLVLPISFGLQALRLAMWYFGFRVADGD